MLRLVPFPHVRADLRLGELPDTAPQQLLILGEPEVHGLKNDTTRVSRSSCDHRRKSDGEVRLWGFRSVSPRANRGDRRALVLGPIRVRRTVLDEPAVKETGVG